MATQPTPKPSWSPPISRPRVPIHCLQVRLLHSKCGHISYLQCHEPPCTLEHESWILENTMTHPPQHCPGMTFHLRMKDQYCSYCESYLESPLSIATNFVEGWFGGEKRRVNPIGLSKETVSKVVEGWKVQMEELVRRNAHDAIVEGWKSQKEQVLLLKEQARFASTAMSQHSFSEILELRLVNVASAEEDDRDSSSRTSEETLFPGRETSCPLEEDGTLSFEEVAL